MGGAHGRRTEPSKSACRRSLSFPYEYGEVWILLFHRRVCRQDELSVGPRQKFDWDMWWWRWRAYLTPWDASPFCEKSILTSRRAGENALASDMAHGRGERRESAVNRNAVSPAQSPCGQARRPEVGNAVAFTPLDQHHPWSAHYNTSHTDYHQML